MQNLSSQIYNKKQNKKITVNGVVENDFASHLLYSVIITVVWVLIQNLCHCTAVCLNYLHLP